MINLFRKFFYKPFLFSMEMSNQFNCYVPINHPSETFEEGISDFFNKNHFSIMHNMFDEEWDEKTKLEEIYKKIILIYGEEFHNENIILVYKNHKKVYLPNGYYVDIRPRSIFFYDKSKIEVSLS